MKTVIHAIIAAVILTGAWAYAFGIPATLQIGGTIQSEDTGPEVADPEAPRRGAARRGSRGPREGGGRGGSVTTVVAVPIAEESYVDVLQAIGTADALHSSTVISEVSGRVIEIGLTPNAAVAAGDALIRLDSRIEEIDLEITRLALEEAQETVTRYERLHEMENAVVTDVTLAEARTAMETAEAELQRAQATMDDRTIRAPIDGRLGLSELAVGDLLSTGDTVVQIEDTEAVTVAFELPERAVPLLATVEAVLASTPSLPSHVFEGRITAYDNRLDDTTRSVTVEARIENPDGALWPGMTFAVRAEHTSDPLPVVAGTALTWSRTGPSIWVVEDGQVESIPVTIRYRQGDRVWIETDAKTAELTVVTEGAQKLRAGSRVAIAAAEGDTSPGPPVVPDIRDDALEAERDGTQGASL